jgi:hypothetical protein
VVSKRTEQAFQLIERMHLNHFVIYNDAGSPYLLRTRLSPDRDWWRKELKMPGVFPHFFFRSDSDREIHNHPWAWSVSFILSGGYWEERYDPMIRGTRRKLYLPGSINRIDRETFHRVELVDPEAGCWTLFVAGPKVLGDGEWGFMNRDGTGFETCNAREARLKAKRNGVTAHG